MHRIGIGGIRGCTDKCVVIEKWVVLIPDNSKLCHGAVFLKSDMKLIRCMLNVCVSRVGKKQSVWAFECYLHKWKSLCPLCTCAPCAPWVNKSVKAGEGFNGTVNNVWKLGKVSCCTLASSPLCLEWFLSMTSNEVSQKQLTTGPSLASARISQTR